MTSLDIHLAKPRVLERFWAKVQKTETCWLWTASKTVGRWGGYGNFWLGGSDFIYAHRLSYVLHHGPIADGLFVCHQCDTPACLNPHHLFLGTPKANVGDMVAKGRQVSRTGDASGARTKPERRPRGELARHHILTDASVRAIRELYSAGRKPNSLAIEFGVARSTVVNAIKGVTWSHVA